jgi:hypothetical protein
MKNKHLVIALLLSSLILNAQDSFNEPNFDNLQGNVTNTLDNFLPDDSGFNTDLLTDQFKNNFETADSDFGLLDKTNTFELANNDFVSFDQTNSKNVIEDLVNLVDNKSKTEILPNLDLQPVLTVEPTTVEETSLQPDNLPVATKVVPAEETVITETVVLPKNTSSKLKLVETTTTATKHNWWKWLGLLALLGALLGFLAATFKKRNYDKENLNSPKKNRHSDREVEFTFEEEKEDKGSEKKHYNKDYKNRD